MPVFPGIYLEQSAQNILNCGGKYPLKCEKNYTLKCCTRTVPQTHFWVILLLDFSREGLSSSVFSKAICLSAPRGSVKSTISRSLNSISLNRLLRVTEMKNLDIMIRAGK